VTEFLRPVLHIAIGQSAPARDQSKQVDFNGLQPINTATAIA